jgi:hypothetical protein
MGLAGGLLNTSQFVAGAFGTALAGLQVADGTVGAYTSSLLTVIVVTIAAGVVAYFLLRPQRQFTSALIAL